MIGISKNVRNCQEFETVNLVLLAVFSSIRLADNQ